MFYPNFYPKRLRGGIEMPHFLVKAVTSTGRPEPVSSLPSWSCSCKEKQLRHIRTAY